MEAPEPYTYSALVIGVHDGDTVTLNIDLGMYVQMRQQKIRLLGVNAPELNEPFGEEARNYLRGIVYGMRVRVSTRKSQDSDDRKEKYGRWLGVLYTQGGRNINDLMNRWLEKRCKT